MQREKNMDENEFLNLSNEVDILDALRRNGDENAHNIAINLIYLKHIIRNGYYKTFFYLANRTRSINMFSKTFLLEHAIESFYNYFRTIDDLPHDTRSENFKLIIIYISSYIVSTKEIYVFKDFEILYKLLCVNFISPIVDKLDIFSVAEYSQIHLLSKLHCAEKFGPSLALSENDANICLDFAPFNFSGRIPSHPQIYNALIIRQSNFVDFLIVNFGATVRYRTVYASIIARDFYFLTLHPGFKELSEFPPNDPFFGGMAAIFIHILSTPTPLRVFLRMFEERDEPLLNRLFRLDHPNDNTFRYIAQTGRPQEFRFDSAIFSLRFKEQLTNIDFILNLFPYLIQNAMYPNLIEQVLEKPNFQFRQYIFEKLLFLDWKISLPAFISFLKPYNQNPKLFFHVIARFDEDLPFGYFLLLLKEHLEKVKKISFQFFFVLFGLVRIVTNEDIINFGKVLKKKNSFVYNILLLAYKNRRNEIIESNETIQRLLQTPSLHSIGLLKNPNINWYIFQILDRSSHPFFTLFKAETEINDTLITFKLHSLSEVLDIQTNTTKSEFIYRLSAILRDKKILGKIIEAGLVESINFILKPIILKYENTLEFSLFPTFPRVFSYAEYNLLLYMKTNPNHKFKISKTLASIIENKLGMSWLEQGDKALYNTLVQYIPHINAAHNLFTFSDATSDTMIEHINEDDYIPEQDIPVQITTSSSGNNEDLSLFDSFPSSNNNDLFLDTNTIPSSSSSSNNENLSLFDSLPDTSNNNDDNIPPSDLLSDASNNAESSVRRNPRRTHNPNPLYIPYVSPTDETSKKKRRTNSNCELCKTELLNYNDVPSTDFVLFCEKCFHI